MALGSTLDWGDDCPPREIFLGGDCATVAQCDWLAWLDIKYPLVVAKLQTIIRGFINIAIHKSDHPVKFPNLIAT
ncbi:MAG TPA: hypothetical protein DCQ51_15450 [Planktothrix sp. UBA8407]|nr:hypothetical protein [Planktothrix sp. UBA8402]HAO12521.1 hypothetical protein [Planktothrix sp. UBA8407]HBK22314.1 hypothetical protein [Planktothrix sp. UBA10369]